MEEKIKEVMAAVFKCDLADIGKNASPDTFEQWDSLGHMNLTVALEEEFGITFKEEEIVEMMNYELVCMIVKMKLP